jgi:hypothetical protein
MGLPGENASCKLRDNSERDIFMSAQTNNDFPKLHNAMWPGLVGKGSPGAEPCIDLDTMLDLTARAEVDGIRFDGVDLFLYDPHVSIDLDQDGIKRLADKVRAKDFTVGSVVAPVWPPTGGGSAMGSEEDRNRFVQQVGKACFIAKGLRDLGARPFGVVRIDSACGVSEWAQDAEGNQQKIAATFREACQVAEGFGERLAAEGEICWGGMHGWKKMVDLLERVNRPETLGFQADMAHTLLYTLGFNAPEDAILPPDWDWSDPALLDGALKTLTNALRPWTVDFHVAQNDATVKGSGTHDKTGHHCLPHDPNGKLSIARHAGYWLRGADGQSTKAFRHVCWDGCMFPNSVMMQPETWNDILGMMISVRDAHGWREEAAKPAPAPKEVEIRTARAKPTKTKVAPQRRSTKRSTKTVGRRPAKRQQSKRMGAKKVMKAKPKKARIARKTSSRATRKPLARRDARKPR